MNQFTTSDVLKLFLMKRYTTIKVVIPTIMKQKIEVIYLMVYRNSVEFTTIVNFLFLLGVDLFYKLVTKHKVKSFVEMMKIAKYIKNSIGEFVMSSNTDDVLIPLNHWHYLNNEFQKRQFINTDINAFLRFVRDNKFSILEDKTLLDRDTIDLLFREYDKKKIKRSKWLKF